MASHPHPPPYSESGRTGPRSRGTAYFTAALLAILVFVPTGVNYVFATASHAPGTAIVSGILALSLLHLLRADKILVLGFIIAVVVVGHLLIAAMLGPVDYGRAGGSLALLVGMLAAASCFGPWLFRVPDVDLVGAVAAVRWFMILLAVVAIAGFVPPGGADWEKAVFPFTEPSHYALAFGPLLIEACVRNKGMRRIGWLLIGFALAYFLENLSLVVAVLVAAAVSLPISKPIPWVIALTVAFSFLNLEYFAERLDLSAYSTTFGTNLSVLVYLQGWELVLGSFEQTYGWGLGFQQLGVGHVNSAAADQIFRLVGLELNLQDGGFVSAKVIAEFGVLGIIAVALFVILAIRSAFRLRKFAAQVGSATAGHVLALAVVCAYTLDMFVRGLSYFSASSLLFVSACFYLNSLGKEGARNGARSQAPSRRSSALVSPASAG